MVQTWVAKLIGWLVLIGGIILAILGMKAKAKQEGKQEVATEVKVASLQDTITNIQEAQQNDDSITKADDTQLDRELDEWMRD